MTPRNSDEPVEWPDDDHLTLDEILEQYELSEKFINLDDEDTP